MATPVEQPLVQPTAPSPETSSRVTPAGAFVNSAAIQQSLITIPDYRVAAFRQQVAARLRVAAAAGVTPEMALAVLVREQQAMACALSQEKFAEAVTDEFIRQMAAELKQADPSHAKYVPTIAQAQQQVAGILANRMHDAEQFVLLLSQLEFVAAAGAESAQPEPAPKPYALPPIKQEEAIRRLVQPGDPAGAEPAVHVMASAIGQSIVHKALANMWSPKGALLQPLKDALKQAWPEAPELEINTVAARWLKARHDPAHSIADGLAEGGPLYEEAMRRVGVTPTSAAASAVSLAMPVQPASRRPVDTGNADANGSPFMNPNRQLNGTTSLTPAEYESQKTRQQKAEDIIYTLNHAVTCLSITDLFVVGAIANVYKQITGKIPGWHHDHGDGYSPANWLMDRITGAWKTKELPAHDHDHHDHGPACDHGHDHAHGHDHGPELTPKSSGTDALKKAWHNSKGWLLSEAIGDLGAVPVTVGLQRFTPGLMSDIRRGIEPMLGKSFRKNTQKAAAEWGIKHGKAADSDEVVDYAHTLYEYEMSHMPQMATWTVLSVAMNYGAIRLLGNKFPEYFEDVKFKDFMANKLIGASITGGLVLGVRAFTPGGAHKWDETVGKKVIAPVTKRVGRLFGIEADEVDNFHQERARRESGEDSLKLGQREPVRAASQLRPAIAPERDSDSWAARTLKPPEQQETVGAAIS